MYVSSWNDIEALFAGKTKNATEVIDYKPGRELEDDFIRKFKRHPSWYVLEYREQHGEHPNWDQFLRDILASAEVPKPKTDDNIDWKTEKPHVVKALNGYTALTATRKDWLENVAMPLHHATNGSVDGRKIFDDWSWPWYEANGYTVEEAERQQDKVWQYLGNSLKERTLGSLYRATGYKKQQATPFGANNFPEADWIDPSPLTDKALKRLRYNFKHEYNNHNPSDEQWRALTHISTYLVAMSYDELDQVMYLSSIDPGVGKTETAVETLLALLEDGNLRDAGAIVCLRSYNEMIRIAKRFPDDAYACYVTDGATEEYKGELIDLTELGLGKENANDAPVLFITQQMKDKRLYRKKFPRC